MVIPNKTSPFIQYLKEQADNHLKDTSNKEDSPPMNTDSKLSKEYNKCTICSDITKYTEDLEKHLDMVVAAIKNTDKSETTKKEDNINKIFLMN